LLVRKVFPLVYLTALIAGSTATAASGGTATATSLNVSPGSTAFGQTVTFTATVSPSGTGVVTFRDTLNDQILGTGTLTGGVASFGISTLALGLHQIIAVYGGDAADLGSRSSSQLVTITPNAPGTMALGPGSPFPTGDISDAIVSGDFNGDGIPDLAVANQGDGTVSVFLANGSGGLSFVSTLTVGSQPRAFAVADFNGDGALDLAVTNQSDPGTLILLPGDGHGNFSLANQRQFTTGHGPDAMTAADFNGDGRPDLAIVNQFTNNVTVLLGDGAGGFTTATGSPFAAGASAVAIVAGDFNGDGVVDLAIANQNSNDVTVLLGDGTGSFSPASGSPFAAGSTPFSIGAADFNKDGKLDLVIANQGSSDVTLLIGNGTGGFTPASGSPFGTSSVVDSPGAMAVGDFNGDGNFDVAVANFSGGTVVLLTGDGTGRLSSGISLPGNTYPYALAAGDFNNDGRLDVAAIGISSGLSLILGELAPVSAILTTTAPATIVAGTTVPLSLTLSNSGLFASPVTGPVTFLDGAVAIGTSVQTSSPYSFTASSLTNGPHTFTATYVGNETNSGATSNSISIDVVAPTTTTVSSSLNPSHFGDSVTFTANVTPSAATGSVTFKSGSTVLGSGSLSGGAATFTTSALTVGSHSITAVYGSDSIYETSTSAPLTQTVNLAKSTSTLTVSPNPATVREGLNINVTISPASSGGAIYIYDGSTQISSGNVSNGLFSVNSGPLTAGSHSIAAVFMGDMQDAMSTSNFVLLTVTLSPTTATVSSSLNPSSAGQSVTFTARVSPSFLSGTVTFKDGSTTLGTGNLNNNVATFSTTTLGGGAHSITAVYSGDSQDSGSTSSALNQTVNLPTTTTAISSSLNPAVFGQSVTFTARVSPTTATGTVTFSDGATALGTGILNSGTATFTTPALGAGMHSIAAAYGGNSNNQGSTSSVLPQNVSQAAPALSWASPAPIIYGSALNSAQLNATANVPGTFVYNPSAGAILPSGTQTLSVTFTPTDSTDYTQATASVPITVNASTASGVNLIITKSLARVGGNVVATLTIANNGGANAQNVVLTSAKIGSTSGTPLPQTIGSIGAGSSAQVTVTFPGTAGNSGAASTMSLSGTYAGGTFVSTARITLP